MGPCSDMGGEGRRKAGRRADGHPPPEDWTPWGGGEVAPIPAHTHVAVWFRAGWPSQGAKAAYRWHWFHTGGTGDIVAYQVPRSEIERNPYALGTPRADIERRRKP